MGNQHGSTTRAASAARSEALRVHDRDTNVLFNMYSDPQVTAKEFGDALVEMHPRMLYDSLQFFTTKLQTNVTVPEKLAQVLEYAHRNGVYRSDGERLVSPGKLRKLLRAKFSAAKPFTDVGKIIMDSAYYRELGFMGRKLPWRRVQEEGAGAIANNQDVGPSQSRHPSQKLTWQRLTREYFFRKIATLPMFKVKGNAVCSVRNLEIHAGSLFRVGGQGKRVELYEGDLVKIYHDMYADGKRDERNSIAEREAESMHELGCRYLVIFVAVRGHVFSVIATFYGDEAPVLLDLNTTQTRFQDYFGVLALVKRIDVLLLRKAGRSDRDIRRLRRGEEFPVHDQLVHSDRFLQEGESVGFCQSWDIYMVWRFFKYGAQSRRLSRHVDRLFTLTPEVRMDRIRDVSNRMYEDAVEWHARKRDAPRDAGYHISAMPRSKRARLQ